MLRVVDNDIESPCKIVRDIFAFSPACFSLVYVEVVVAV